MTETRTAQDGDGPRLRAIDRETWTSLVTPAPQPPAERPFFGERTRPEDVIVAVENGEVVGYVLLAQTLDVPSHAHVLTINALAVSVAAQGSGLGGRLVEEAVAEARRRGARKVTLRVLGDNVAALRLYTRCGFAQEGVLVGEFVLDGRPVDDVLMARTTQGAQTTASPCQDSVR